ncbi:hypothetical protein ACQKGO_32855 [Corallococcus interemptor]|uniref:hypothetical protein n=1 Tax=Corallococcus interemptor TaxID=2316720 RepID=UPI003D03B999
MAPVTLYKPSDLVKKASSQALFPWVVPGTALPTSRQQSLVGLKRLMKGRGLDPHGLEATVYDTQSCVVSGTLLEASGIDSDALPIFEPGNPNFYNGDENLLALVMGQPPVAQSFNLYYLHWGFDSTHCVRLGSHANYFITAALQGCSIFVTGDPASPTVYHLNASSETVDGGTDDQVTQAKVQAMRSRFSAARKVMGGSETSSASAAMTDYMPGMLNAAGTAQMEQERGVSGASWYHLRTHAYRSFWKVREDELLQFGTVFGVRESGRWSFYFQRRTRHAYSYKTWTSGRANHSSWDVRCERFWPA